MYIPKATVFQFQCWFSENFNSIDKINTKIVVNRLSIPHNICSLAMIETRFLEHLHRQRVCLWYDNSCFRIIFIIFTFIFMIICNLQLNKLLGYPVLCVCVIVHVVLLLLKFGVRKQGFDLVISGLDITRYDSYIC